MKSPLRSTQQASHLHFRTCLASCPHLTGRQQGSPCQGRGALFGAQGLGHEPQRLQARPGGLLSRGLEGRRQGALPAGVARLLLQGDAALQGRGARGQQRPQRQQVAVACGPEERRGAALAAAFLTKRLSMAKLC